MTEQCVSQPGNTYIFGTMTYMYRIEIPTASLGFLATASSIKVHPRLRAISTMIDAQNGLTTVFALILQFSVVRRCQNHSSPDTFSEIVMVENSGLVVGISSYYSSRDINISGSAATTLFPAVGRCRNHLPTHLRALHKPWFGFVNHGFTVGIPIISVIVAVI